MAFDSLAMTVTEMRDYVAQLRYQTSTYATSSVSQKVNVDLSLTAAGRAASLWDGRGFWWSRDSGTFPTIASTSQYDLRTVNSSDMDDLYVPYAVYWGDEYRLTKMTKQEYDTWVTLFATTGTGNATRYTIFGAAQIGFKPIPDSVETITVKYFKVQGKIANTASNLIVPPEYHFPIFCHGALHLLRNETTTTAALHDCPPYMEAITEMKSNDPERWFDLDMIGVFPTDRRVFVVDGGIFVNDGSLSI